MSIGVIAGIAGALGGATKQHNVNVEAKRLQGYADRAQAEEDRQQRSYEMEQVARDTTGSRPNPNDPVAWQPQNWSTGGEQTGQMSPVPQQGALPYQPPFPVQGGPAQVPAVPTGQPQQDGTLAQPQSSLLQKEGAAMGGSIQGPEQGALPTDPALAGPPAPAAPAPQQEFAGPSQEPSPQEAGPPAPAPQKPPTYRENYAKWKADADAKWMKAGGLEGYAKFQEMENATSRKMVMGYGLQAIQMLDEGNVGEAMRAGNSALEVTPFDTGLKFESYNGGLYMRGKDGQRSKEPYTANDLRAFVENNLKTPENYLDWKKQSETERSNLVTEGISQKNAESSRISSEAQAETASHSGQLADAATASSLASVIGSLSRRDAAAQERAGKLGWKPNESIQIIKGANDFFMGGTFRPLTEEVGEWFTKNPEAEGTFRSDVSQLMLEQGPGQNGSNTLDFDKAAIISQLVRLPGGANFEESHPDFEVRKDPENDIWVALYEGQYFKLPPSMAKAAEKNFPKRKDGAAAPAGAIVAGDPVSGQTGGGDKGQTEAIDTGGEQADPNWMAPQDPQVRKMMEERGIDPDTGKRPVDYSGVPFIRKVMPDSALGK